MCKHRRGLDACQPAVLTNSSEEMQHIPFAAAAKSLSRKFACRLRIVALLETQLMKANTKQRHHAPSRAGAGGEGNRTKRNTTTKTRNRQQTKARHQKTHKAPRPP